jgi:DNA-binding IclR family transcriptional regulator
MRSSRKRETAASDEEVRLWSEVDRNSASIEDAGFSVSPSFYVDAVTDIVAPVRFGPARHAVAALAMPYISGRSTKVSLTEVIDHVRREADAISASLTN